MLVKLCLGSLEEKGVRGLSFFKRPCCLVYIVLWVAVSDCCIYVFLNDIGNDQFCRSNMNSDTCNLYRSDIFNMLSDLNKGSVLLRCLFLFIILITRFCKTPSFVMLVELPHA